MQMSIEKAKQMAALSNNLVTLFRFSKSNLSLIYFSDGVPAVFGMNEFDFEKVKEKDVFSLVSEYDVEFIRKGLIRSIEFDEPYSVNVQVKNTYGNLTFFAGTCHYLGSDEEAAYFYCNISDEIEKINKNKDYKRLFENEGKYKYAIEFGNIFTWDYEIVNGTLSHFENVPTTILETFDYADYPISLVNSGIIDDLDSVSFLHNIERVQNGENNVEFEYWHHFKLDRHSKYLKVKYMVEYDENHNPLIAHGLGIDLTEQKNAEMNFNHITNSFLRMNPDSLATFQLNISENICKVASSGYHNLIGLSSCTDIEDLVTACLSYINDKNEQIRFINAFSRGSLLASFNSGIIQVRIEHHMLMKGNYEEWVRTVVDMVKNPISGDVEAVMNIINIHHGKVIDSLINGTVQREFEFIALAYIKTNSYVLLDRYNQQLGDESPDFLNYFRDLFTKMIQIPSELEEVLNEFTIENLVEKINLYGEYTIRFNSNENIEKNHHRILKFSFLNNRRDIISISCRDASKFYNLYINQKMELTKALNSAENANKAKSEFLSLVSHDIRTPLNGIMGMMQLAMEEQDKEKVTNYLQKAEMSSKFLLGLINDLLDMSKIESGKIELHPEVYPYTEFEEYINSVIKPLCQKKNISFVIKPSDIVPYLLVDKLRLNQIIFNILSNACKYTNEGGVVELLMASEKVNDSMCITTFVVKDNGIGMSDEFQEHLFETFAQENRMSFDHNEGTGLGLSITKSLIELMGGEITVNSILNKGTTFTIQLTFPYFDEIEETPVNNESSITIDEEKGNFDIEIKDYSGYNFLLCEDNIINQEIAIEILTNLNAKVDVADDGEIGVSMFEKSAPGYYKAIFMDLRMPNMDGLTASKHIRESNHPDSESIAIIAMTANAMSEDKMECVEAGMNAFIAKPINVKELYSIMNNVIN